MPGPGAYGLDSRVGKEGRRYTIYGRSKSLSKSLCTPGPAAYNIQVALNKAASGNNKGFTFGTKKGGEGENKWIALVPGPGKYEAHKHYTFVRASSPAWG